MIAPTILLNRSVTPRTLLCRRLHYSPTSFFFFGFEPSVGSVVVLAACFAFVPFNVVDDAGSLFAGVAPEFGGVGEMHLAGFAAIEVAPCEAGTRLMFCSGTELDITMRFVSGVNRVGE